MNIILNNPYRKLSVLANAKLSEITTNYSRLKQYIEADAAIPEKYQKYVFRLGQNDLTSDQIEIANSKINLDKDKFENALFWFYDGHLTDEPAFDELNDGNIDKAISIWEKRTKGKEIDKTNLSAFHNYTTILIWDFVNDDLANIKQLINAVQIRLNIIEGFYFNDYLRQFTDSVFSISVEDAEILFLKNIELILSENKRSSLFFDLLDNITFKAKDELNKKNADVFISNLESLIQEIDNSSKLKSSGYNKAIKLYNESFDFLKKLESILGKSSIRYNNIADKIAMKIFQNGRDYFMHYRDESDPSVKAMDAFKKAKTIARGNIAIQQIEDNINQLNEWIDEKPERDKQKMIDADLKFITTKLERFQNLSETVSNAKDLVESCKPKLDNIKSILGSNDDFYLKISSAVANNALGMLIAAVNKAQETIEVSLGNFTILSSVVRSALTVSESIGSFDLISSQKTYYTNNHKALKSIASQLGVSNSSYNSSSSSSTVKTSKPTTSSSSSPPSNSSSNNWALWMIGISAFIGLIVGGFGGMVAGVIIGFILVGVFSSK